MHWSACEMRSDTISTKTDTLQSSGWEVCVGRGLCWSSADGAHCTETAASLTEKGSPTECRGVGLGVIKLGNQHGCCAVSPQVALCCVKGWGSKMSPASSFVPGEMYP